MSESLFSLEVHVESVQNLKVSCSIPAITYRLLDFPTLIIHHVSPLTVDKLREKAKLANLGKNTAFPELRDRFGNVPFNKGKSCLFRMNVEDLHQKLQVTPIYVMLVDVWPKKPKLIGSTTIPLKRSIDRIIDDVKKNGVSVPSFSKEENKFDIFNLMGSKVGKAVLGVRLLSLGGSLIPHIPTGAIVRREDNKDYTSVPEPPDEEPIKSDEEENSVASNFLLKPSEVEKQNSETQTERKPAKYPKPVKRETLISEDVLITNTVCPPPLFYNIKSHTENNASRERIAKRREYRDHDEECGDDDDDDDDRDSKMCRSVMIQTEPTTDDHEKPELAHTNVKLNNFPLLNALVKELSQLHTETPTAHKEPNLPAMELNKKILATPRACTACIASQASDKKKKPKRPHSVPSSQSKPKSVVGLQKKVKFKKTNLTYGMTRTQLMRLERNKNSRLPENASIPATRVNMNSKLPENAGMHTGRGIKKMVTEGRNDLHGGRNMDFGATHGVFPRMEDGGAKLQTTKQNTFQISDIPTGTVVLGQGREQLVSPGVEYSCADSGVKRNSLEISLPQVENQDSDDSIDDINKSSGSETKQSQPHPLQDPDYSHTGIPREPSQESDFLPAVDRSRTSTALSMYSDDFEAVQGSDSRSNSVSSRSSYHSVISQASKTRIEPVRSTQSPLKVQQQRKHLTMGQGFAASGSSIQDSSSNEREVFVDSLEVNPGVTLQDEDSRNSPGLDNEMMSRESACLDDAMFSDEFHSVGSSGNEL
ncbi:predicted protein [Nematostella vectensis]|uniref:Microtubule-associated protein 10 n=1 Tax=Nematostella vectensis TaxID=45351 RepID=A7RNY5_NEMVE|nr:microtubule-associated protein 10 [Nematostella vectensis]EDO46819.1 predicted protein [Nematostella vectensis]|eukprot:XP_001638882.1 predicted protein [Nematostella vectensis]